MLPLCLRRGDLGHENLSGPRRRAGAASGKRMRRLAIELWRYLEHGEIPAGALLKPAAA